MGCKFSTVKRNFTEDQLTHEIDYDQVYAIYRNPPSAPPTDESTDASAPSYDNDLPANTSTQNALQNSKWNGVHFMAANQQKQFS